MSGEIIKMPGAAMAGPAEDDATVREWLKSEILPDRPEGDVNRVTLHRADHQGHMKARIKTVPVAGKPSDERLGDMASELILAAERDARGPCGAPIYVAKLWTATGPESVGELPFVPSQAAPSFNEANTQQILVAMLAQSHNFSGEMQRRSVAMMVAQSTFADRQIERAEAETNRLRAEAALKAAELEEARQQNHERKLEADRQAAQLQRGKEVFDLVKGGIDLAAARWAPKGAGGDSLLAKKLVAFINGMSDEQRAKVFAALPPGYDMKLGAIAEIAAKAAGEDVGEEKPAEPEPKA